jgi:hypothetical protein
VLKIEARNGGPGDDEIGVEALQVPTGWDVSLPTGIVSIAADTTIDLPIIMGPAFAHSHGATASFILEMTGSDDSVGRVELGAHYPLIPLTTGRHDTMWIHSAPDGDNPFGMVFSDV